MNFEFVVQTGTEHGKQAAKRTVRSQAMKAFRKRQRAERVALVDSASTQHSTPQKLQSKPGCSAPPLKLHESGNVPKLQVLDLEIPASASNGKSPDRPTTRRHHGRAKAARRKLALSFVRSPAVWSADPFSSASDVDKMVCFAAIYVHWLRPDVTTHHAATVCAKAWTTSPCPMLMSACCMAGAVDLNNGSQPLAFHKSRVLRELADRMLYTETATSDETISALVFLASAELSKASSEARTHLRGLHMVLFQRFGTKSGHQIPDARFARVVQTLEMTLALMFDEHIHVPEFTDLPLHRICDQLNDILVGEQLEYLRLSPETHLDGAKIRPIFELANQVFACISILSELKDSSNAASQAFWKSLEEFREHSCRDGLEGSMVLPLARANYHANAIIYNTVANGRSFRHSSNSRHVGGLAAALQASSTLSWRLLPFLQLFVILTGLTAARDPGLRSELKRHLWTTIFASLSWRKTRRFMLLFVGARAKLHAKFGTNVGDRNAPAAPSSDVALPTSQKQPLPPSSVIENDFDHQQLQKVAPAVKSRRSAEEMLESDHGFHQVIRDGGCWLTEIE